MERIQSSKELTLEEKAKDFATWAHSVNSQLRKYTNEPYITHPSAVVELVRSVPHTEEMIVAAWLHDTVEDTSVSLADIEMEFGIKVAELVEQLTDISKPTDGNRKIRKAIDLQHTAKASPSAKTIKLADLIDNTKDIVALDLDFAKVYLPEKALLLKVLTEGDSSLWKTAAKIVI